MCGGIGCGRAAVYEQYVVTQSHATCRHVVRQTLVMHQMLCRCLSGEDREICDQTAVAAPADRLAARAGTAGRRTTRAPASPPRRRTPSRRARPHARRLPVVPSPPQAVAVLPGRPDCRPARGRSARGDGGPRPGTGPLRQQAAAGTRRALAGPHRHRRADPRHGSVPSVVEAGRGVAVRRGVGTTRGRAAAVVVDRATGVRGCLWAAPCAESDFRLLFSSRRTS